MRLHQIKVELAGVRPPVWRRVLLSPEITLGKLHRVLQAVMGWEDSHAHSFVQDGRTYSDPRLELDGNAMDERRVSLGEILTEPGSRLIYEYDFGDDWKHELLCEGSVESEVEAPYAVCADGARSCPPEDCGGPLGYADLLQVLKNPQHKDYPEMRAWLGTDFDPEAFDCGEVNKRLAQMFRRKR
jgi:hypothetical protein